MPIGNAYLSEYHLASVNYPRQTIGISPDPPGDNDKLTEDAKISSVSPSFPLGFSSQVDIAYKSFSRKVDRPVNPMPMIQGWPLGKIADMQMATYSYQIEVPIILLPHTSGAPGAYRIRAKEIEFFTAWFSYAISGMDKIFFGGFPFSVVVEKLSVQVTPEEVVLQLSIKSNADIGWNLIRSKDNILMGRTARGHDTFLGWENTNTTSLGAMWGWQDKFGISSFSMNLSSEIEEISASEHILLEATGLNPALANTGHSPDMLNCQLVRYSGNLSVFGLTEQTTPDIRKSIQFQTSNEYNTQFGNTGIGTPTSPTLDEDVFDTMMSSGGIYVVIGATTSNDITVDFVSGQSILFIPNGTIISGASTDATGGLIRMNREFSGLMSHVPYVPDPSFGGGISFNSILR